MSFYEIREFQILDNQGKLTSACAQFKYKGYQVSMSTIGILEGGCHSKVVVYCGFTSEDIAFECDTVEQAIDFINAVIHETSLF